MIKIQDSRFKIQDSRFKIQVSRITREYFELLEEAGNIVGVKIFNLEWKTLGEVAIICDGIHQTPKYTQDGIPFISVENIKNIYETDKYISKEDFDLYKIKPKMNDIFMTRIGDIGTCVVLERDIDLAYYVTLSLIRVMDKSIMSKYIKYLMGSIYGKRELNKRILHNAVPIKINLGDIGKLKFLIPPIEVQEYVVSFLDKFDKITNDLKEGIPAEIELRQKQYEYYREKLLNFSKETD